MGLRKEMFIFVATVAVALFWCYSACNNVSQRIHGLKFQQPWQLLSVKLDRKKTSLKCMIDFIIFIAFFSNASSFCS